MKKAASILLSILFFVPALLAYDGYNVTYQKIDGNHQLEFQLGLNTISTMVIDGQTYSVINFEGNVHTNKAGFAELPYIHSAVKLEADRDVDLQITGIEYEDIQLTYPLLPSRGVIYRDQDPSAIPYIINPKSITDAWYPGDLATSTEPYILRDIRGTNVYVYPFQYNAEKNILRVYTSLTVSLQPNTSSVTNPLVESSSIVYEMDAIYRSVFVNYGYDNDNLTIGEMGDILVVCTDRDVDAIEPYIQWKREKGFNVSTEIVAAGTNVVSLVQAAYDNNNDLLYVQLVGDWADIKCNTLYGGSPPMDPQIGCVAGGDQVPDIAVGRFSAENPTHVTTQVDKVITYEKNPQMGAGWYTSATGIASDEGAGDDGEYDFEHLNVIYDDKLEPTTYTVYNDIYDPGASSSDVTTAVDNGTSIINYTGHGSPTSWGTTGFSNSKVSNLDNGDMTPWIISVACNNGDFHTGTCFAEAWQRHEGGGSVMFLGASISQPWNPPMRGQDYFTDLLIGGYDYTAHAGQNGISTTEGRTTLGAMVFNGLVLMTTEAGNGEDWETAKTWNLFGDPSMQARTATPVELALSNNLVMASIPFETNITAGGNPLEGAMVTLSQGGNYYTTLTDAAGFASINHTMIPGEALLVVTAFNTETIYETINVIPANGPYVIYAGHVINDADGNNDGMLDYGESVDITLLLTNVGTEDATNVDAELASSSAYIEITDPNASFGTIPSGDTITITDAFAANVASDVPDLQSILFNVTAVGEDTWNSSFTETAHAPVLSYASYSIDDSNGNANGKLDAGETVEMTIALTNSGSSDAEGVVGILSTNSGFISIESSSMNYGALVAGDTVSKSYTVTAATETPPGHNAEFIIEMHANQNITGTGYFFALVGQIPVLVIDLDENNNSANEMMACFDNLSVSAELQNSWPDDMNVYASIFVCLGVYPENHVLSNPEGQELANYLDMGGRLYMEGGDTWAYNDPTPVHPMFNIDGLSDGSESLGYLLGQEGTFTEGLIYYYSGDDSWIDHIAPLGDAFTIFENQSPEFMTAVANDAGSYRTIGSSFEFGGMEDGDATKDFLMHKYLEFFGVQSIWTGVPDERNGYITQANIYPNPFNYGTNISLILIEQGDVRIDVYNHSGQLIDNLLQGDLQAGTHEFRWNADGFANGIYFFRIISAGSATTLKAVLMD